MHGEKFYQPHTEQRQLLQPLIADYLLSFIKSKTLTAINRQAFFDVLYTFEPIKTALE